MCFWVCAGLGVEWHREFTLQVPGGRAVLSSAEPSRVVGGCGEVGAIQTEFEEARGTSEAAGAKLCRREWELKSAWFATHIAFEVRSLPRVTGEKNSGKRPSVYNRSVS